MDEKVDKIKTPPTKYSNDVLNDKYRLRHLIKNKQYQLAKQLKANLDARYRQQDEVFKLKFKEQLEKKKNLLYKKQQNEYEALKTRLEKNINTRLSERMKEYEQLLQRMQNLQNELMIKQSVIFSKI